MRLLLPIRKVFYAVIIVLLLGASFSPLYAESTDAPQNYSIDRVQLVTQQINLLKNRYKQAQHELITLQQHEMQISQSTMEKASKSLLDKAGLDNSVAKSNLDSTNIELADTQQTISWLTKNSQEIQNQINVMGMFGKKAVTNQAMTINELKVDLIYQTKLLALEKIRLSYLKELQVAAQSILQLQRDKYYQVSNALRAYKILNVKQQQIKDELAFQEQQNHWLQEVNSLYVQFNKIDPTKSRAEYLAVERDIFYANENASFAYVQSLLARYKDQIQQMNLAVYNTNSISLLNEVSDQVQVLTKQMARLEAVVQTRSSVLQKHISYLTPKKAGDVNMQAYVGKLTDLRDHYQASEETLNKLTKNLTDFRHHLDSNIQKELSSRQGLPTFSVKMMVDLGREMLLVPTLTFQIVVSLASNLINGFTSTSLFAWTAFIAIELFVICALMSVRKWLTDVLARPSAWREKINWKWLSLQWLQRNFLEVAIIGNVVAMLAFFGVPYANYIYIVNLSIVWLLFKSIYMLTRICLVETTQGLDQRGVKLYNRMKWIILVGGVISALTVFVHLLPLIYEIKTLCDRIFLFLLMVVSLLYLRVWDIIPNLMLSYIDADHPYLRKSIRLVGLLVPILLFGNSLIGLLGYVNLVLTISSYEAIFLIVLTWYLIFRGLLTDGMEQVSRLTIHYTQNGWLWTEAFVKPIDKVLRITLFLSAWAMLFIFYGWDKQSPIVSRLDGLLHYRFASILGTTIMPINVMELVVVISIFCWTAKWTREFVFRLLSSRTKDMGVKNTVAILSQYTVIILGGLFCLRVLGINLQTLNVVAGMLAFGIGMGLKDLANNFACGFLILLERPLRVGDIVEINGTEGEVAHIGSRAVTVRTWDCMEFVVPNTEIFNKSFINWTFKDNIVRCIARIKIGRQDNPHAVRSIVKKVMSAHAKVLAEPHSEVYLKEMNDTVMDFELRFYINIRQVSSRTSVISEVLMNVWDAFNMHGIKPPYPQQEIFIKRGDVPAIIGLTEIERAGV